MLTDLQFAQLLQSQYKGEAIFDYQDTIAGVTFAVKQYDDCTALFFEGSHDLPDWRHDAEALMIYPHELNGAGVHAGFWMGIIEALTSALPYLPKDKTLLIGGHSLGAGRTNLATAYLATLGYTMMRRVKFGAPRSNDAMLTQMIEKFPVVSYWNYHDALHHDFICNIPRRIYPAFLYDTDEIKTMIDAEPQPDDTWGEFAYHHMFLYINGLQNL